MTKIITLSCLSLIICLAQISVATDDLCLFDMDGFESDNPESIEKLSFDDQKLNELENINEDNKQMTPTIPIPMKINKNEDSYKKFFRLNLLSSEFDD